MSSSTKASERARIADRPGWSNKFPIGIFPALTSALYEFRAGKARNDVAAIDLQSVFLFAAHQINVELGDAQRLQFLELAGVLGSVADDAESVDDFVCG